MNLLTCKLTFGYPFPLSPLPFSSSSMVALVFFICAIAVDAVASIAIDFGGEWMKTGLVMPGVPMEIVLNQ